MPNPDYLAQIAALIRKNPSITVREIAAELKFADAKSVYYWFEKAKVSGINEFKRQVLSENSPYQALTVVELEGIPHYLIPIPLFGWNPQEKSPVEEWYHLYHHPDPQGLFAVRVGTNKYSPWFTQNDILIISQSNIYSEAEWVLFKSHQDFHIGKAINGQLVDPTTLEHVPTNLKQVGVIIHHQRSFLP